MRNGFDMAYKQPKLWFDKDLAKLLSSKINNIDPDFNAQKFIRVVDNGVTHLELKDRVDCIADMLYNYLGKDYKHGISILLQILGSENSEETGMFTNYYWVMPIAKYVEKYGLSDFSS